MKTAPRTTPAGLRDQVDPKLEIWKQELPDLDLVTEGIVERIQWANGYLNKAMNETLAEFGLNRGEWALLGTLRRYGRPYRRSPGQLAADLRISSGAMTNRLDRLEEAGLIRRLPDPDDRRSLQVELTDAGWQAWQDSVGAQAQKEALVAAALDEGEKLALNDLLRRLMLAFEESLGPLPKHKHQLVRGLISRCAEMACVRFHERLLGCRLHSGRVTDDCAPSRSHPGPSGRRGRGRRPPRCPSFRHHPCRPQRRPPPRVRRRSLPGSGAAPRAMRAARHRGSDGG